MAWPSLSSLPRPSSSNNTHNDTAKLPGDLSPERARELGLEAYQARGQHGGVSRIARKYDVSRAMVKWYRRQFEIHLKILFRQDPEAGALVLLRVSREHVVRALIGSRAELPVSIRSLICLSAYFLNCSIGFGTIWNIISAAEAKALGIMSHPRCQEVGTYLKNQLEGLTSYIWKLTQRLSVLGSGAAERRVVRTMAQVWRLDRERRMKLNCWRRSELRAHRNGLLESLKGVPIAGERLAKLAIESTNGHPKERSSLWGCDGT